MSKEISKYIDENIKTVKLLKKQIPKIEKASFLITNSLKSGGKLILFGNGGSAADAQHIAAEFVGKYNLSRKGLPAISLTTNSSAVTAIGNDLGYDKVFSRQLEALATKKDIIVAISTSGNSKNVITAINLARKNKIKTIALTGRTGGKMSSLVDISLNVPSTNTQHIQESHIMLGHILVGLVETALMRQ